MSPPAPDPAPKPVGHSAAGADRRLICSISGLCTGAIGGTLLLALWPAAEGVCWTHDETLQLAALGGLVGGLLGGVLGATCTRAGLRAAGLAGLVPISLWSLVPWLPVGGRAVLRVEPAAAVLLLGLGLVLWGMTRIAHTARRQVVPALVLLGLLARSLPMSSSPEVPTPSVPPVVLITVDTTRADLVPGFGGDLQTASMPFMESWGRSARRFVQAWSPTALTGPSHTSILSGQHVLEHGILANGRDIPPTTPWVPELLQARGWHTRARVSAAVLSAHLGFERGFDDFDSTFTNRLQYGHPLLAIVPRRRVGGTGFVREDAITVEMVHAAGQTTAGSFTWVHLYGPHWPYTPDPQHARERGVAPLLDATHAGPVPLNQATTLPDATRLHAIELYKAELRTLDDQLRRLLTALPEHARVVVVADHGESLDEHGLLFNHGRLASAPSTRVPLWVRGPGYPAGEDRRTVGLHQVAGTLLHLGEVDHPLTSTALHQTGPDAVAVTVSDGSVFRDEDAPHSGQLGAFAAVAVRSDALSLTGSSWHAPGWSLHESDPRELTPVPGAPAHPAVGRIEEVWSQLLARPLPDPTLAPLKDRKENDVNEKGGPSAEARAALEALGYLEAAGPGSSTAAE